MRFCPFVQTVGALLLLTVGVKAQENISSDTLNAIAFNPDGKVLASCSSEKVVRLWDVESGKLIRTLEGHEEAINSVHFHPNGTYLASGSDDAKVNIWDVHSGEMVHTLSSHLLRVLKVEFSSDGTFLVSGAADGQIKIWSTTDFSEVRSFSGHGGFGWINDLALSGDGKHVISGSSEANAIVWDTSTGEQVDNFEADRSSLLPQVLTLGFSPKNDYAVGYGAEGSIFTWEMAAKDIKRFGVPHSVHDLEFSSDGRYLVLALDAEDQGNVMVMDFEGKTARTLHGHIQGVRAVAFHPDGKRFATGALNGVFKIWNAVESKVVGAVGAITIADAPLHASMPGVVLAENFSDNALEWELDDDEEEYQSVQNGVYMIRFADEESGTFVWNNCPIEESKDFRIATRISHVRGVDDSGYGLLWGLKDINNCFGFEITANGHFRIYKETDEGVTELVDWTETDAVKTGNEIHLLSIEKKGDQMTFYINSKQIHQMPFQPFLGNQVGFSVWSDQFILVDYVYAIQGGE